VGDIAVLRRDITSFGTFGDGHHALSLVSNITVSGGTVAATSVRRGGISSGSAGDGISSVGGGTVSATAAGIVSGRTAALVTLSVGLLRTLGGRVIGRCVATVDAEAVRIGAAAGSLGGRVSGRYRSSST
jgi:hypothetical protein